MNLKYMFKPGLKKRPFYETQFGVEQVINASNRI